MRRIDVMSGPERRRRWGDEEKRAIVAAAFAPGAIVADVARRADVCASQVYRWRRDLETQPTAEFAEVLVLPDPPLRPSSPESPSAIEIRLPNSVHMRIPSTIPADLAAAVIKALR